MPQADNLITVQFVEEPTGILFDVSDDPSRVMSALEYRLHNTHAILALVQQADEVPKVIVQALCGVQDMIEDCFTLMEHYFAAQGVRMVGVAA